MSQHEALRVSISRKQNSIVQLNSKEMHRIVVGYVLLTDQILPKELITLIQDYEDPG